MRPLILNKFKIPALVKDCQLHGVGYSLGAKAQPLALQAASLMALDCSGFVRWAIYHASLMLPDTDIAYAFKLPDGSVQQHEWCDAQKLERSPVGEGSLSDGVLRIAFLTPQDGGGIGHVMLIQDGFTLESHGGVGPDRRKWLSVPFMAKCQVYKFARLS